MTTDVRQRKMKQLQDAHHPRCVVCGVGNKKGLKLTFQVLANGSVEGRVPCRRIFQGYKGLLHGGVISAILDSAMTNCLFAHDVVAVTGELTVRFLYPVPLTRDMVVRANIRESSPPLHYMEAQLTQNNRVVARASAKFVTAKPPEGRVSGKGGLSAGD